MDKRELDIAIAKEVEHFYEDVVGADYYGEHGNTKILLPPEAKNESTRRALYEYLPRKGKVPYGFFVDHYSTDEAQAWDLLRKMQRRGYVWDFRYRNNEHFIRVYKHGPTPYESATTKEHAISLAVLEAARLERELND